MNQTNAQYVRFKPSLKVDKEQRPQLLREYFAHYSQKAEKGRDGLNVKIPRVAFKALLDELGNRLVMTAKELSAESGPVRDFVDKNPLPACIRQYLPDEFRVFCLLLNALKQWVIAEQAATDRYLLGAGARQELKAAATKCLLSGEFLNGHDFEFHHPVRDGRPPIPVNKAAHAQLEGQMPLQRKDPVYEALRAARKKYNRSWKFIREGCDEAFAIGPPGEDRAVAARSFFRRLVKETGIPADELRNWLARNPT